MDGDWDCDNLAELFRRLLTADLHRNPVVRRARWLLDWRSKLLNLQTRVRSMAVAEEHYDLDHRLYELFLGPWNQYTCCFFDGTDDLAEAEVIKLEMICNKLDLRESDRVLDIGCGWGGFARYAASTRGCQVTGISLSVEQIDYARRYTAGLPVEIVKSDYRDLPSIRSAGSFDKVLICGMIEHVGYKNYRTIMQIVHTMLADDGLFLLHTLGNDQTTTIGDPWMEKYIFRNSMMPSMPQLADAAQGLFTVHDWENYGHYYARTVQAWNDNFNANWEAIQALDTPRPFDERFKRMFNYYFMACQGAFSAESTFLWHIVMSKRGQRRSVYPRVNLKT
jgi:cyclopropane-fatty-acyl-phospholipid synthase